jgi:hypothetical protein
MAHSTRQRAGPGHCAAIEAPFRSTSAAVAREEDDDVHTPQ